MRALEKMMTVMHHKLCYCQLNKVHFALQWLRRDWHYGGVPAAGDLVLMLRENCFQVIIEEQKKCWMHICVRCSTLPLLMNSAEII